MGELKVIKSLIVGPWPKPVHERRVPGNGVDVHHCESTKDAPAVARTLNVHWIVAGPSLDDMELYYTLASIQALQPAVRFAMLGEPTDWRRRDMWLRRGCYVYLDASSGMRKITEAIRHSTEHDVVIADGSFQRLQDIRRVAGVPDLTQREREVLELLHRGLRNREIADSLHISINTVEYHMRHILQKLGARSRLEAVERSTALGIA